MKRLALILTLAFPTWAHAVDYESVEEIYNPYSGYQDFVLKQASIPAAISIATSPATLNDVLAFDGTNFSPTSTATLTTLTASSFTVVTGTVCIAGNCFLFQSTIPAAGVDLVFHLARDGQRVYFGGDGMGAAGDPGSGGSDNLGSHVSTRPIVLSNGFSVITGTNIVIGTESFNSAGIAYSTTSDTTKPLVVLGTGTAEYELWASSFVVNVGTSYFNGTLVINALPADQSGLPSFINGNFQVRGGSFSVLGGGGISATSGTFTSSVSAAGGLTSSLGMLAPSATFYFLAVSGSTITFNQGTFGVVFSSPLDTTPGKNHLIWTRVANGLYMIGSGGDVSAAGGGDNLGNHIATQLLELADFGISNSTGLELGKFLQLTTVLSTISAKIDELSVSSTIIFNQESPDISNRTYYLHNESSGGLNSYHLILSSPSNQAGTAKSKSIASGDGLVIVSSHITLSNDPGVRKLPAGIWSFVSYLDVTSVSGLTQLIVSVSTIGFDGTRHTEILSSTSSDIDDLGQGTRLDLSIVQQNDIAMSTSDRIAVRYFARTTSVVPLTFEFFYGGTSSASHLNVPIGGVYKFTQLTDAPSTLAGQQGKYLSVNNDQTATVFVSSITDSFNTYTGTADVVAQNQSVTNSTVTIQFDFVKTALSSHSAKDLNHDIAFASHSAKDLAHDGFFSTHSALNLATLGFISTHSALNLATLGFISTHSAKNLAQDVALASHSLKDLNHEIAFASHSVKDLNHDIAFASHSAYNVAQDTTIAALSLRVDFATAALLDVIKTTSSELSDNTNTINAADNPVSWNSLKDVPAGFADGSDATGAGGGDWSHVSTRPIVLFPGGFSVITGTSVVIGTQAFNGARLAISTTPDTTKPLVVIGTGTAEYEFWPSSFTVNVTTTYFNGTLVIDALPADQAGLPSIINGNLQVKSGSFSVVGGGGVDSGSYTIRGTNVIQSSWSAANYSGFTMWVGTGSIAANTTRTFTAAQFGFSIIGVPVCTNMQGGAAPTLPIFLQDNSITTAQFQLTNPDLTNIQKFSCHVPGRPQ